MIQVHAVADGKLSAIPNQKLPKEDDLQRWIAEDPQLIGLDLLIIGREIYTSFSARIDILGLDQDGNLVVIECKRERTPREIIGQLLDYGSWVTGLNTRQVHDLALKRLKRPLADAFADHFESTIPETLNNTHSLIVVATEFDPSSRRIVEYLAQTHNLAINAIFFSTFEHKGELLLALEWLLDQEDVVERAESKTAAPWSGLSYVNIGQSKDRNWEDMRRYGFISAGGGAKYVGALQRLAPNDEVVAYQKGVGYVGYGIVLDRAVPVDEFQVDGKPILGADLVAPDFGHNVGDINWCEFVARVDWKKTYPLTEAKTFPGIFANQNIVCKLRHQATIKFLEQNFPISQR